MSAKSIDGLQKRTGGRGKTEKIGRAATGLTMKRQTKNISINHLDNTNKTHRKLGLDKKDSEAVKDFLSDIKDSDPTDLLKLPQEEEKKGQKKKEKKKVKKEKKKKKGHKRLIVLSIFLVLIVGGGVWLYNYLNDFVKSVTDNGNIVNVLFSDPDTPLEKDENGRTNILVFGTEGYMMDDPKWDGGYLTDSMLMLSVDQETGDAKAVSLPRDLKARTCTSTGKINEIFWCKYSKVKKNSTDEEKRKYEEEGALALEATFEEVFGVNIQYHVHANWQALIDIVDALGGIDVVFLYGDQTWDGDETTIYTTDKRGLADGPKRKYHYQYPNGQVVHLTGEYALAVARTRNAYGGYGASRGNFSREYFQQRIIEAIAKKAKNTDLDLAKVMAIKSTIGDNLRTNFKDTEIKTLVKLGTNLDFAGLTTISLYDTVDKPRALLTTGTINGISYVLPTSGVGNYSEIHAYMKRKLSGASYTDENASLVVLNGTAATGIAANEKTYLEGKSYIVSSTGNAPSDVSDFDGVKIYQISANKPKTAEALLKLYGEELITEIPESLSNYKCDFIVVVGNGVSHAN